ncbi:MAG TPA: hypothetical protein VFB29_04490 [Pseudolabrys sp.]|nr:hypothetical protein [Pseudolabrys sp.]
MTQPDPPPLDIVDFKAERYAPDGKTLIVSFATAQSAERRFYALPVQSLYGFIGDLQKLQPVRAASAAAPAAAPAVPPAPQKPAKPAPAGSAGNRVEVTVPKRWMARPLPERNVVVMVFDPETERQTAYALPPQAIREMAGALIKQADVLEKPAPGPEAKKA